MGRIRKGYGGDYGVKIHPAQALQGTSVHSKKDAFVLNLHWPKRQGRGFIRNRTMGESGGSGDGGRQIDKALARAHRAGDW